MNLPDNFNLTFPKDKKIEALLVDLTEALQKLAKKRGTTNRIEALVKFRYGNGYKTAHFGLRNTYGVEKGYARWDEGSKLIFNRITHVL